MHRLLLLFIMLINSLFTIAQSHWESIILANHVWKYLPASTEPPSNWMLPGFSDAQWQSGPGGIGYGDDDDATIIANANSVYLRITFEKDQNTWVEKLLLDMDYDDGFVAYLNGVEIARSLNLLDTKPVYNSYLTYDKEAQMYQGGMPEQFPISESFLVEDTNLLAVQIINVSLNSSDLSSNVFLHAQIAGSEIIYFPTPEWFTEPLNYTSSNLPIIKINTLGQAILDDPKIVAQMGIINNGTGATNSINDPFTEFNGRIAIELRGQSSQMFPKKSFSLETQDSLGENLNVSLLGMPAENDWILYAPYSDKSMMRNVVTFELAKKLGHYCSRTVYCELYINNTYEGVYVLMEKIKNDKNRVDIATLNPNEISGDDVTGGYIFKVDKIDWDYEEGYTGWKSQPNPSYPNAMDIIYQYYYPKPDELVFEQRDYLKSAVNQAEKILINYNFSDPNIGYNQYLNTGSFVDFLIMSELSKEVDKYRYSTYFHKKKESNGGEIFAGPIWDFNLGYANVDYWYYGLDTKGWLYTDVQPNEWSLVFWWKRLMEDVYFNRLVSTRWKSLRNNEFSNQQITFLIDSLTSLLNEPQERNYSRWPILGTYVWPNYNWQNNSYQDEVSFFRNWLFNRLSWMDANVNANPLHPEAMLSQIQSNSSLVKLRIHLMDDYFNHAIFKKKNFTLISDFSDAYIYDVYQIDASTGMVEVATSNPNGFLNASVSIAIDQAILNGFNAITTNPIIVSIPDGISNSNTNLQVFAFNNTLQITTDNPSELPDKFEVFNKLGQLVAVYPLDKNQLNQIPLNVPGDIYIIRIQGKNFNFTQRVFITS